MRVEVSNEIYFSVDLSPFHNKDKLRQHLAKTHIPLYLKGDLLTESIAWRWSEIGDRIHGRLTGGEIPPGETYFSILRLWFIEKFMLPTDKLLEYARENNIKQVLLHTNEARLWSAKLAEFSMEGVVWVENAASESIKDTYETLEKIGKYGYKENCGIVIDLGHLFYKQERSRSNYKILLEKAIAELAEMKLKYPDYRISFHIPLGHNGYIYDAVNLFDLPGDELEKLLAMGDGPVTIESQGTPLTWINPFAGKRNGQDLVIAYNYIRDRIPRLYNGKDGDIISKCQEEK